MSETYPSLAAQADRYLEGQHDTFVQLGDVLFDVFDQRRGPREPISTQVRNLQQIVATATYFVEIEDFIKNQMGKDAGKAPDRHRPWLDIGEELLQHLKSLRECQAGEPGQEPKALASEDQQLQFRLRLARGWVRAIVSQYLYRRACWQMAPQPVTAP